MASSAKLLDDAYRTEHNGDVRERLLLVRRVLVDNEQTARVAENEFHRSRWWAFKWVKRYAESGLEGLKNLPRTGRPPQVSGQKFGEIKRELSENLAGWRAKEVMNIIYDQSFMYTPHTRRRLYSPKQKKSLDHTKYAQNRVSFRVCTEIHTKKSSYFFR